MRRQLDVRQQEVFASVERLHCSNSGGTADFIFVLNDHRSGRFFIYASNEPKSVLARDLGDCRDNLRNSRSVFLIVYAVLELP